MDAQRSAWFSGVMHRYRDMVFRVAYTYLRDQADADDVAQTVFVKLLRDQRGFASEEHMRNWLVRVTVNECKSLFRKPWRRVEDIEDYAATLSMPTKEHVEVFASVMKLPERYRVPLVLYYFGGFSLNDICDVLGIKPACARKRLSRAREHLKTMIEGEIHEEREDAARSADVYARG